MATLIDRISKQLQAGGYQQRSAQARKWLQKEVATAALSPNIRGSSILRDDVRKVYSITPGKLYFYVYDPKTKEKLPFYDSFPLVLPIDIYAGGFMGLNFHYISPKERIALMDKLYETATNKNFNENTRITVSYDILKNVSKFSTFKPCLKKYLNGHIRSDIIEISAEYWEVALMLPVEKFVYKQ